MRGGVWGGMAKVGPSHYGWDVGGQDLYGGHGWAQDQGDGSQMFSNLLHDKCSAHRTLKLGCM